MAAGPAPVAGGSRRGPPSRLARPGQGRSPGAVTAPEQGDLHRRLRGGGRGRAHRRARPVRRREWEPRGRHGGSWCSARRGPARHRSSRGTFCRRRRSDRALRWTSTAEHLAGPSTAATVLAPTVALLTVRRGGGDRLRSVGSATRWFMLLFAWIWLLITVFADTSGRGEKQRLGLPWRTHSDEPDGLSVFSDEQGEGATPRSVGVARSSASAHPARGSMSTNNASGEGPGSRRAGRAARPRRRAQRRSRSPTAPRHPPTKRSWMRDYLAASGDHQDCGVPFAALADRYSQLSCRA